MTLVVDRAEAAIGSSISVHGSGCLNPSTGETQGAHAHAAIGVGLEVSTAQPQSYVVVTPAKDGSFAGTLHLIPSTSPGDQEVKVGCEGPPKPSEPPGSGGVDCQLEGQPVPIHITGATPMRVSPTSTHASGTVQVRALCEAPGDYELLGIWLTRPGVWPTALLMNGGGPASALANSSASCHTGTATATLSIPADLPPGHYMINAWTSDELVAVGRQFQPGDIEITGQKPHQPG
jgi:hypothetical protein